ncbi:ORF6N domain-containing protein [Yersinia enterocolitica]|uniref:hypothetical protein n=1 Tax=Yersinia enterocolitica TaxID=630 RepID=UPI0036F199DD
MNYARNKERFVVGKHLFKLQCPELKELKYRPTISRVVKIVSNVRSLILWTKRGGALYTHTPAFISS